MAAGTFTLFSKNKDDININDLVGATIMVSLVGSGYTPGNQITGAERNSSGQTRFGRNRSM